MHLHRHVNRLRPVARSAQATYVCLAAQQQHRHQLRSTRHVSTQSTHKPDPTQSDANAADLTQYFIHGSLLQLLSSQAFGIGCKSANITVLTSPTEFYTTLLDLTKQSQHRITLSSLYLGTGKLEQQLVQTIADQCSECSSLKVHTLFDYLRGTRQTPSGTTVDTLQPLLRQHCTLHHSNAITLASHTQQNIQHTNRVRASFFHVPVKHKKLWHRLLVGRNKEAIGVHHMKFYIFDDTVIISGANLSDTYFTNRQDRYVMIQSQEVADFYDKLADTMADSLFCYAADNAGTLQCMHSASSAASTQQLVDALTTQFVPSRSDLQPGINAFHSQYSPHVDCWIFPTIQLGSVDIRHDERMTESLMQFGAVQRMTNDVRTSQVESTQNEHKWSERGKLDLTTGYMNFTSRYTDLLLASQSQIRIISASYTANGWYGAKSIFRYIPDLYAAVAYQFIKLLDNKPNITYVEYTRPDWSYHGKGMWYTNSGQTKPNMTLIGSPNFGLRSVNSDSESSIVIVCKHDSDLCHRLEAERDAVLKYCDVVTRDRFEAIKWHHLALTWYMQLIARVAKHYM